MAGERIDPKGAWSVPGVNDGSGEGLLVRRVQTTGHWFGSARRPLAGWLTSPVSGGGGVGVVILPPLGYEYLTSHRMLRTLAERLAGDGCTVLRVDYDGTGDSSGDQLDGERLAAWRTAPGHAVAELRSRGSVTVVLVGLRFGATVALLDAEQLAVDAVVACAPVTAGRRYMREITLLAEPSPHRPGAVALAGNVFEKQTLEDLASIDLLTIDGPPAPRLLLVDRRDGQSSGRLVTRLEEVGSAVDHHVVDGLDAVLDRPTEEAVVPTHVVDDIARWVEKVARPAAPPMAEKRRNPSRVAATIPGNDGDIVEEFVCIGERRLVGVLGRPAGPSRATVVWLNPGSEHHVGPGRAWVEYSRALNRAGYSTLRVDFRGWGESPDDGHAPGRPYDGHSEEDARHIVAALRATGHARIVLAGLCAGAWITLRVATDTALDGVVAINPLLWYRAGDPWFARIADAHDARAEEIAYFAANGARLEGEGEPHPASRLISELGRRETPTLMVFAAGDDGLRFLQDRLPRQWHEAVSSGLIDAAEIEGMDHPMHRHWCRGDVMAAVLTFLDSRVA